MTGVAMNTVLKLLADLGEACATYHDEHVRNVRREARFSATRFGSSSTAKAKNVPER